MSLSFYTYNKVFIRVTSHMHTGLDLEILNKLVHLFFQQLKILYL